MTVEIPKKARELGAAIRRLPGVVCVSWGLPRRKGEWAAEPCLVAHVRWKHRPTMAGQRIRSHAGIDVDVIEVGRPHTLSVGWFDQSDHIVPETPPTDRRTSPTAVSVSDDVTYALVSGHGTLTPAQNGFSLTPGQAVALIDPSLGRTRGKVVSGAVGRGYDFAYVRFDKSTASRWAGWHYAAGAAPHRWRRTGLRLGETVGHFSPVLGRRRMVWGTYQGDALQDVAFDDAHAGRVKLGALRTVISQGETFALPGDSGSLVVDAEHRAIGVIVGTASSCAYVMSLLGARTLDRPLFDRFFVEER